MTGDTPKRVLAFEPWCGGSHAAIIASIERHGALDWTWITRPARAFRWRMRLGALELAREAERTIPPTERFDALFVTSLCNAAELRAALPRRWARLPLVVSMHENQAAYPLGIHTDDATRERDAHLVMVNLASLLAADRIVWNSEWNRRSFLDGIGALLRHHPDPIELDWRERIDQRSVVVPPPVEDADDERGARHARTSRTADRTESALGAERPEQPAAGESSRARSSRVLWPHRWEHDKGPDELLAIAERDAERLDLRFVVLGERYRRVPAAMRAFLERFESRIDHAGFVEDRARYRELVASCDWVLSTARHEFFGIAVAEALLDGCLPWLPDRLSYPELLPACARALSPAAPPANPEAVRRAIREHLEPARAANAVASLERAVLDVAVVD